MSVCFVGIRANRSKRANRETCAIPHPCDNEAARAGLPVPAEIAVPAALVAPLSEPKGPTGTNAPADLAPGPGNPRQMIVARQSAPALPVLAGI
jgi:hypothetical protein